jgi:RNA polymerase sigma factor (sigma-70 family)
VTNGRFGPALRHIHTLFRVGTAAGLTDGQLLERFAARGGEAAESAFAALLERHGPMVLRVCRRVLADPHEAEDAFQATFLVLVRKAGAIRDRDSVAPWLHGVALRVASHARAAAIRRRDRERRAAAMATPPAGDAPRHDLAAVLHEEVDRLPGRYRAAVVLCYLEGRTCEEAARQLRWPVGTVKSRLARARDRLRSRLARRGLAPTAGVLAGTLAAEAAPEAVPPALELLTISAAMRLAAGPAAAGTISAPVAALFTGVLKAMFLTKLKVAATGVVALAIVAVGAGVLAQGPGPAGSGPDPDRLREVERKLDRVLQALEGPASPHITAHSEARRAVPAGGPALNDFRETRPADTPKMPVPGAPTKGAPGGYPGMMGGMMGGYGAGPAHDRLERVEHRLDELERRIAQLEQRVGPPSEATKEATKR